MQKEAKARLRINDSLIRSGWRFFDCDGGPANVALEAHVKIKKKTLDDFGDDFEKTASGFVDYLLLGEDGFPVAVLEAKSEGLNPLVGKVPDPKSQVEQITIALIYKFMDDMDRQSEEIGGKVTFFTGDFKKYRWSNLLDRRLGGHERLLQSKWPTVSLGEMCTFMTGGTPTSTVAEYYEGGTVPWLVSGDIHGFEIWDCEKRITLKAVENSNARVLPKDSVLIALNGQGKTRGTVALLRMEGATCNQSLVAITPTKPPKALSEFIFWTLRSMYSDIRALTGDTERSGLNIPILKSIQIPLPPLEVQKEIVAEIEGYQSEISRLKSAIGDQERKIQATLARVWGEKTSQGEAQ